MEWIWFGLGSQVNDNKVTSKGYRGANDHRGEKKSPQVMGEMEHGVLKPGRGRVTLINTWQR